MKNEKAFTLTELIGVLIILAIIALLLTPTIDKSIKNFRSNAYQNQIIGICTSFENWKGDHISLLPQKDGDKMTIPLSTLKNGGYVEPDLMNPSTGKHFPNDMLIEITKQGKNYVCNVLEDSGNSDDEYQDGSPVVALKGSSTMVIEVNSTYIEPGVIAKTANGEAIPNEKIQISYYLNGQKVNAVDTSILNATYKAVYLVEDRTYSVRLERTILVRDTTPPIITVEEHTSDFTITHGPREQFTIPTGTAVDNVDGVVEVISSGNVTPSIPGVYNVVYKAMDSSGNSSTLTLTVVIAEPIYSDWLTESELVSAGHSTTEFGVQNKTQYGYQDVTAWNNIWSTTKPSDGYYRTKTQYNLTYTKNSSSTPYSTTWDNNSQNNYTYTLPSAATVTSVSFSTSKAWYHTSCNGVNVWTSTTSAGVGPSYRKVVYCDGTAIYDATNNNINNIQISNVNRTCSKVQVVLYGTSETAHNPACNESGGFNKTYLNSFTVNYISASGTTGWQDSNTTNLGTVTNTQTRTVYDTPLRWSASTGWRDEGAYNKTTSRKPVTRKLYRYQIN